jgi:hypothetical protein
MKDRFNYSARYYLQWNKDRYECPCGSCLVRWYRFPDMGLISALTETP